MTMATPAPRALRPPTAWLRGPCSCPQGGRTHEQGPDYPRPVVLATGDGGLLDSVARRVSGWCSLPVAGLESVEAGDQFAVLKVTRVGLEVVDSPSGAVRELF